MVWVQNMIPHAVPAPPKKPIDLGRAPSKPKKPLNNEFNQNRNIWKNL